MILDDAYEDLDPNQVYITHFNESSKLWEATPISSLQPGSLRHAPSNGDAYSFMTYTFNQFKQVVINFAPKRKDAP